MKYIVLICFLISLVGCEFHYVQKTPISSYKTVTELKSAIAAEKSNIESIEDSIEELKERREFLKDASVGKSEFFTNYEQKIGGVNSRIDFEKFRLKSSKERLASLNVLLEEKEKEPTNEN